MLLLRQSTAVTISFGPAVLNTDGVTLVTNLTGTGSNQTENTSTGIRLSKNGGAFAARHATAGASTYDAFGNYLVPLDTTDTNTLGTLRMQYANAAAFCPIFQDFMVINTALWDALCASSGGAIPNAAANAAGGLPISAAGALDLDEMNVDIEAIQASTAGLTFTVANQVDSNVLDWKSATAPAMTGDAFARLGAPAGASVSADVAAVKAETAEIDAVADQIVFTVPNQIDVNVVDWKGAVAPAMTGDAFARLGAPAGASVSADVAAVKAETAEIDAIVDLLPNAGALTNLANLDVAVSTRTKPADTQARVTLTDTVTTYTGNTPQTGDTYAALTGAQAEPGQGAPAANASPLAKLSYIFKAWRNRNTQTATAYKLYNDDATTVDQKATYSDDGTTADRGEIGTGP